MIKKGNVKSFVFGACAALTVAGTVTALAENIDVTMGGIKIFWDGIERTLTDAKGKKVEPMIYQGTTYVPLRAVSKLMEKDVAWDQEQRSVYIGKKPTMRTIPLGDMEQNINLGSSYFHRDYMFNLKHEEITCDACISLDYSNREIVYVLDKKYGMFTGKMVMPYNQIGDNDEATITFYSVKNDGTENEIRSFYLKQTEEPVRFEIDVTDLDNLKVACGKDISTTVIYDAYFLGE